MIYDTESHSVYLNARFESREVIQGKLDLSEHTGLQGLSSLCLADDNILWENIS